MIKKIHTVPNSKVHGFTRHCLQYYTVITTYTQMSTVLKAKLNKAVAHRLDLSSLLSDSLYRIVTANADAIGCTPEFIFYPLLTTTASFMGIKASISISSQWTEPAVMWFVVAAKKGEKKTAALKTIRQPIERIESELKAEWEEDTTEGKPSTPPQICIDHFSFEELHCVMKRNHCRILGFFDEMSSLYGQLDLFKHNGSTVDRKTLITLNGGGQWTRNSILYGIPGENLLKHHRLYSASICRADAAGR